MIDGVRLRKMMTAGGLSQSELARRINVSQATIYKLVSGVSYGSKHIHKVARELGTTTAYLEGETDDPNSDLPDEPDYSSDERELIACYRDLSPPTRAALMQVARSMADNMGRRDHPLDTGR